MIQTGALSRATRSSPFGILFQGRTSTVTGNRESSPALSPTLSPCSTSRLPSPSSSSAKWYALPDRTELLGGAPPRMCSRLLWCRVLAPREPNSSLGRVRSLPVPHAAAQTRITNNTQPCILVRASLPPSCPIRSKETQKQFRLAQPALTGHADGGGRPKVQRGLGVHSTIGGQWQALAVVNPGVKMKTRKVPCARSSYAGVGCVVRGGICLHIAPLTSCTNAG